MIIIVWAFYKRARKNVWFKFWIIIMEGPIWCTIDIECRVTKLSIYFLSKLHWSKLTPENILLKHLQVTTNSSKNSKKKPWMYSLFSMIVPCHYFSNNFVLGLFMIWAIPFSQQSVENGNWRLDLQLSSPQINPSMHWSSLSQSPSSPAHG